MFFSKSSRAGLRAKFVKSAATFAVAATAIAGAQSGVQAQEKEKLWENVQKAGVLRVGVAEAPPHLSRDPKTGKWSGFFVEMAEKYGEAIGVKVEPVETTWGNMVAGLQAGKWDISLALNRNPKRSLAINYSIPAWSYEIGLLYNKQNPKLEGVTTVDQLDKAGVTIAVMQGAAGDLALSPVIKNAKLSRMPGANEGRLAVISRRADVFATDSDIHRVTIGKNPDWAQQILPNPAIAKQGIAFGFRKSVPLEQIQTFNIFLEELIARGETQRIYDRHLKAMIDANK